MTVLAQFATPPEELSVPLWPLVLLGILYALCFVAARVLAGRDDSETAGKLDAIGFGVMVLAAVYTLVIGIYALTQRSEQIVDAIEIMLIIFAFFALLLLFMLLLETVIGSIGRARQGRRAVQAAPPPQDSPRIDPPSGAPAG